MSLETNQLPRTRVVRGPQIGIRLDASHCELIRTFFGFEVYPGSNAVQEEADFLTHFVSNGPQCVSAAHGADLAAVVLTYDLHALPKCQMHFWRSIAD
mmetsp:Transcript_21645/g.49583  ORF Transcript_21645/g.49583 Transcript_21645/m.49583 type:complete len:98 (+) Transcript_21645:1580-1873(+)